MPGYELVCMYVYILTTTEVKRRSESQTAKEITRVVLSLLLQIDHFVALNGHGLPMLCSQLPRQHGITSLIAALPAQVAVKGQQCLPLLDKHLTIPSTEHWTVRAM